MMLFIAGNYWVLIRNSNFFDQWSKFLSGSDAKGINKDVWDSVYRLHQQIGGDVKKFDEDDFWPILIDDFVHECLLKK